jgi:hypothetical protein
MITLIPDVGVGNNQLICNQEGLKQDFRVFEKQLNTSLIAQKLTLIHVSVDG